MGLEIKRSVLDDAVSASYVDLREGYSGRGMYGKECVAVVGDRSELDAFERELAKAIVLGAGEDGPADPADVIDDFIEVLEAVQGASRSDSMGLDEVRYFPGVVFTEG